MLPHFPASPIPFPHINLIHLGVSPLFLNSSPASFELGSATDSSPASRHLRFSPPIYILRNHSATFS